MIRLCVFDLGGTIIDKYSLSPFLSLKNAFKTHGVNIHNSLIFDDMGKDKKEHIKLILNDKYVKRNWFQEHGSFPTFTDTNKVYNEFCRYQLIEGIQNMEIIPETKNCINYMAKNSISTGVTTGFNKPIMMNIRDKLSNNGIFIDSYVSSTCLQRPGRPNPYMIKHIMDQLSITNPKSVVKIDDTVVGIQEGKAAGCVTVGVAKWSTNMLITKMNQKLTKEEYVERIKNSRLRLKEANPDFIVTSLDEVPALIETINYDYL
tara:strand:- start:2327 stop:3109 length:783 start_codon:yes stop_codon:yes gene_type:complete